MGRARALVLVAPLAALLLAAPAAADPVAYRPPVPGPVIDPYRAPGTPYGPGNRGIDYATTPGEPVGAAADGEVTFAGAVAGGLHVVVLHADGIRTSLSFLAAVLVRRGQRVAAGQPVGLAASSVHFGARRGEAYLDPATLLAGSSGGRAVLVPEGAGRPLGVVEEAAGLRRLLAGGRTPARAPGPPPPDLGGAGRSRPPAPAGLRAPVVGTPPAGAALLAATAVWTRRRRLRARPPLLADGRR